MYFQVGFPPLFALRPCTKQTQEETRRQYSDNDASQSPPLDLPSDSPTMSTVSVSSSLHQPLSPTPSIELFRSSDNAHRSVSFAPSVQSKCIPSVMSYSEQEKKSMWLTLDDYADFKEAICETVEVIDRRNMVQGYQDTSSSSLPHPNDSERDAAAVTEVDGQGSWGLEIFTRVGRRFRRQQRNSARRAVFYEQRQQRKDRRTTWCWDLIARSYKHHTKTAQYDAQVRGSINAQDVEVYLYGHTTNV